MVLKKILIVDDEENILTSLRGVLEDEGFCIETAKNGEEALNKVISFNPDIVLLDIWMPGEDGISVLEKIKKLEPSISVIIMSGHGTIETAVKAIKFGAFDFLEKPLQFEKLLVLLDRAYEFKELKDENIFLKDQLHLETTLTGQSPAITSLKQLIALTAPSNGWVLITGENGSGKELVARALHDGSLRRNAKFVAVNSAAIPEELIESELFGHEKGSFTGAYEKKIGKFELAHKGTLFLDEIGDMSPKMQAKILRVLQECSIQRVGGKEQIEIDIRVIAATNKDLFKCINEGTFREDLYYRLNVIPIRVPPLRERKEDIEPLVKHFIKIFGAGKIIDITPQTIEMLKSYPWPGNVRELKNWVERACIMNQGNVIDSFDSLSKNEEEDILDFQEKTLKAARAEFEKRFILKMLSEQGGNVSKTAQVIGIERSHLHKKMKAYGIFVDNNDEIN